MRILYIATSFPEPTKGATIYTDLAEALQGAGHQMTVAVSEQAKNKQQTEIKKERGFDVLRIVTGNYYDVGFIEKGFTTLKMPVLMKRGIKKYLGNKEFDLILFESPPVTNESVVAWAKQHFNCPAYLMLKDIFPQNGVDIGIIKKNSMIHHFFIKKEKKLLETADYIGCMSDANKLYVLKHNQWIDSSKVELFPNTKKLTANFVVNKYSLRTKFGIPKEACVFLFGGNMGRPQYIDLLCEVIKACKDDRQIYFLFIGRGTDRYKLEKTIEEHSIQNAQVIGNLPRTEYEQITKECDVGLIVLDPRFTIPNYPSRILSYMEYAKPILAVTDKVTDIRELIAQEKCGKWVWSGDVQAFIDMVKEMTLSKNLRLMGMNGRKYLEENLNVECSVEILERHFEKVR
ncbi:glycosyltransferase family 4 protein [Rummeliibacillus sp. JY-2-4R]